MVLFGKREVVFKVAGDKARWRSARAALKSSGIRIMESGSYESGQIICGCGAKIDHRNYGPKGWIDRHVYYVSVSPEDVERAKEVLTASIGLPLINLVPVGSKENRNNYYFPIDK